MSIVSLLILRRHVYLQGLPQHLSRSLSQVWCLVSGAEVPAFEHLSKPSQLISDPFSMDTTAQTAEHVAEVSLRESLHVFAVALVLTDRVYLQMSRVLQSLQIPHKTHFCPFPTTTPCVDVLLPQSVAILVSMGLDPEIAELSGSGLTHTPLVLKQKALYAHGIRSQVVRASEWPSSLAEQTVVIRKFLLQISAAGHAAPGKQADSTTLQNTHRIVHQLYTGTRS